MREFSFTLPQQMHFGMGAVQKISACATACGAKRPFIVSDPLLKKIGLVDRVEKMLADMGADCAEFLDVEANPSVETVDKATEAYLLHKGDLLIALGGGSPMDVAKAVAIVARYGGSIVDYEGYEKVPGKIVPIIAVPTTAGTGSEVTGTSVINDRARKFKFGVCSREIVPQYALLDPELIMTLPRAVAANTSVDAFIHCFEAYMSVEATPSSDCFCEKGMELAGRYLRRFVANRKDEQAACGMMLASYYGGIGCAKARLGMIHAMAHPISAYFNVPHGAANAMLLGAVTRFNALADHGKYETVYRLISAKRDIPGGFESEMLADALEKLVDDVGISRGLLAAGVCADAIGAMAADAMKSGNALRNPRQVTLADAQMLFRLAL